MKLIFAQGNPGKQYEQTRHNVGFLALDYYANKNSLSFQSKMKFNADIAEHTQGGEKIIIAKPMTFYNETGVSARAIADFYKIAPEDILVIHDELMLPFGKLRVRHAGRDAGNNGIKSLNNHLGDSFARIRIGIQNDLHKQIQDTDFVLGKFTEQERKALSTLILPEVSSMIDRFIDGNLPDESISISH
mgnify:CR=1 FL=1